MMVVGFIGLVLIGSRARAQRAHASEDLCVDPEFY